MNTETLKKLGEPFPPDAIGTKPEITCPLCKLRNCQAHEIKPCAECGRTMTTAHVHVDYVGHAHVRERLNEADPEWTWEPLALTPEGLPRLQDGAFWIRLTVGGKTHIGVGDAVGHHGGRMWKELIGDALRNAAMSFGVALDQWKHEATPAAPLDEPAADDPPAAEATPEPVTEPAPAAPAKDRGTLHREIRAHTKRLGHSASKTAHDFTRWSKGEQYLHASSEQLAEYLDHLTRGGA